MHFPKLGTRTVKLHCTPPYPSPTPTLYYCCCFQLPRSPLCPQAGVPCGPNVSIMSI
uniref:Uncharacterized protein n=1 Tax=Anguilla anguilla TaxID=7936 RepID=A0A0E9VJP2_ANGAN